MALFGSATSDQTERAMAGQLLFALVSLIVLVVLGSLTPAWGRFFGWTMMTICCSSLVGVLLGVLFGLPTQRIEVARPVQPVIAQEAPDAAAPPAETLTDDPTRTGARPRVRDDMVAVPYSESTSLEQVADWLTKIIIGVTLTQYASWEQRFYEISVEVTANLSGSRRLLGACLTRLSRPGQSDDQVRAALGQCAQLSGGAVPGGLLMLTFATLGFLVAYLWMRRYFIIEMVVARNAAIETMRRTRQAEEQVELLKMQASLEQVRAEAVAAQLKSNADVERARQDAAESKAQLDRARAALEDKERRRLAETAGTLQLRDGTGDEAYAAAALARAQQMLPSSDRAQNVIGTMIADLAGNPLRYPDDPWRGLFGGDADSSDDRVRLTAAVKPLASDANQFDVTLAIEPFDVAQPATLSGQKALFFLHPTFGRDPRAVSFGPDGRAVLPLIAYGAFTVGVLLENGHMLELNLAEVADAPELFRVN